MVIQIIPNVSTPHKKTNQHLSTDKMPLCKILESCGMGSSTLMDHSSPEGPCQKGKRSCSDCITPPLRGPVLHQGGFLWSKVSPVGKRNPKVSIQKLCQICSKFHSGLASWILLGETGGLDNRGILQRPRKQVTMIL